MTITGLAGKDPTAAADLLTIPETARRIGLHADTLYRLCRTGQIPRQSRSAGGRGSRCPGLLGTSTATQSASAATGPHSDRHPGPTIMNPEEHDRSRLDYGEG